MEIKDEKLIAKSIKHWNKDIVDRLAKGDRITFVRGDGIFQEDGYYWNRDRRSVVKMYSEDCALCDEYIEYGCLNCPLDKKRKGCGKSNSPYSVFRNELNLESAQNMVKALEAIKEEN